MRITNILAGALTALALPLVATTVFAQNLVQDLPFGRSIGGSYAGGEFNTRNIAQSIHSSGEDTVSSDAEGNLRVQLFNQNWWIYNGAATGVAHRWSDNSTNIGFLGSITVMNSNVLSTYVPNSGAGDVGFDQTRSTGSITFFNASGGIPIGPITVNLSLSLKGRVDFEATQWSHVSSNPRGANESDFSLSGFQIKPTSTARGSVTVLTVGVYGEVDPLAGSIGPVSAATRQFLPASGTVQFNNASTATASLNAFGGQLGVTGFGLDLKVIDWGAPWTWSTSLFPNHSNTYRYAGTF